MLHRVNAKGVIDPQRQMHYRIHNRIDPSLYPQVHDFYELTLMVQGNMQMLVNDQMLTLPSRSLILLRPGDVHSRSGTCVHINLAFDANVIQEMLCYLGNPEAEQRILSGKLPPVARLSPRQYLQLYSSLEKLPLLPVDQPHLVSIQLRRLMPEIIVEYILPALSDHKLRDIPLWLQELDRLLESPQKLGCDLDQMAQLSGYTKEHLCRCFRKYWGMSPTEYINRKRLNYAANLLINTDHQVIDIAYSCGFRSLSRFYHAFRERFGMSPNAYRRANLQNQEKENMPG